MLTTPRLLSRVTAAALCAGPAMAQFPPPPFPVPPSVRLGAFSSWPIGIIEVEPTSAQPHQLLYVEPVPRSGPPMAPTYDPTSDRPDYRLDAIMAHLTPAERATFGFDAIDTGNLQAPPLVNWNYILNGLAPDLQQDRWLAVTATVTNASPMANSPLLSANQGSDLVSYVFVGSNGVPTEMLGRTHLEQTADQIGILGDSEISGFDFELGMLQGNPKDVLPGFAPHANVIYYSVTKQWADDNPSLLFATPDERSTSPTLAPDAAVIYRSVWFPQSGYPGNCITASNGQPGNWSLPMVFRDRTQLGLSASADEDIDALSVDNCTGLVLFSTALVVGVVRDQLLVNHPTMTPNGHMPLYDIDEALASTRLGVDSGTDDIDGICCKDPEITAVDPPRGAGTMLPSRWAPLASTDPLLTGLIEPVGLSVARSRVNQPNPTLHIRIGGWGTFAQPVPCEVELWVAVDTGTGYGAWASVGQFARAPSQDTWDYVWNLPATTVVRAQFEAILTCTDPNQWLDPSTGNVVPSTDPGATDVIGATWPIEIRL